MAQALGQTFINGSLHLYQVETQEKYLFSKWVNEKEVKVFQMDDQLKFVVYDHACGKQTLEGPIPFPDDFTADEMSEILREMEVCFQSEDVEPSFIEPVPGAKWDVGDTEVSLHRGTQLIWQIFNRTLNKKLFSNVVNYTNIQIIRAENGGYISKHSSTSELNASYALSNALKHGSLDDQIYLLRKDCWIRSIKIGQPGTLDVRYEHPSRYIYIRHPWDKNGGFHTTKFNLKGNEHFVVDLCFHRKQSRIDLSVCPTKFTWSVTLVTSASSGCGVSCNDNHAELMIEGNHDGSESLREIIKNNSINEGDYFALRTDFTGYKIRIDDFSYKDLRHKERAVPWLVSSEKVKSMLQIIQQNQKNTPKFSKLGADSIFSGGKHNCFTWAKEQMKMLGIELKKSSLRKICYIPKLYTDPKDNFCDVCDGPNWQTFGYRLPELEYDQLNGACKLDHPSSRGLVINEFELAMHESLARLSLS